MVSQRRSLIDVAPTILQAFDAKPAGEGDFIRGHSLLVDALLPKSETPTERPVLVDMPEGPHNKQRRAFYSGDHKVVVSNGRVIGLFDLKSDPDEKKDLSEDAALKEKLQAELDGFLAGLSELPPKK